MNLILALAAGVAVIIFLVWMYGRKASSAAAAKTRTKIAEDTIVSVKDAQDARERLTSDPSYAERVRNRFRRK